jgi:restriction system protein
MIILVIFASIYILVRVSAAKKKDSGEAYQGQVNVDGAELGERTNIGESMEKKIRDLSLEHVRALSKKKKQLIHFDDYGQPLTADYIKELKYFISSIVPKSLTEEELHVWMSDEAKCIEVSIGVVDGVVRDYHLANEPETLLYSEDFTPREFEVFCGDLLKEQNWKVQLGKGTQDQGVDIFCEKAGKKVCIQCKKYSQPVGNSAVQEAYAGKTFSGADIAAVVSNADFTPSAKQLASTNKVLLLHYDDLRDLDSRFKIAIQN